jgi:hypothetical protein
MHFNLIYSFVLYLLAVAARGFFRIALGQNLSAISVSNSPRVLRREERNSGDDIDAISVLITSVDLVVAEDVLWVRTFCKKEPSKIIIMHKDSGMGKEWKIGTYTRFIDNPHTMYIYI